MPTYENADGRRIQTGIAVNEFSEKQKWIGILAYKPGEIKGVVPYVSRSQLNPKYGYERDFLSEEQVLEAMGYYKGDLTIISELPQTIHALVFVDVPLKRQVK